MIRALIGTKGTGKTKQIIEMANEAASSTTGHVVVLEKGDKLRFDISHKARLIDTSEYGIGSCERLIGFVEGIIATNYDVSHIYIDGMYKMANIEKPEQVDEIFKAFDLIKDRTSAVIVVSISDQPENLSDYVRGYMVGK